MKKFALALAATASAISFSSAASAANWLITYRGHVVSGYDATGEFGTVGATLDGAAFTAVYRLTEPTPGAVVFNDPNFSYTFGSFYDGNNPLSASVTINGIKQLFTGALFGSFGQADQQNDFLGYDATSHQVQDGENTSTEFTNNHISNYILSNVNNIVDSSDYHQNLNYRAQSGDTSYGYLALGTYDFFNGVSVHDAAATLYNDSVTISQLNAVPEPASWALMIAGFSLVGAAARRRSANRVPATSKSNV